MAKRSTAPEAAQRPSRERAARLYRMMCLLQKQPRGRDALLRSLRVGMRTFYRDLDLLRVWGIDIGLEQHKYCLSTSLDACLERLPFPDPELSFAEAQALAKGNAPAARKLKKLVQSVTR